jgi:small subunit ribosomal protein S19
MSRSLKKWPYVYDRLLKKVSKLNELWKKTIIKTWSRDCTVVPEFVWHTFWVHNWKVHTPVFVTEDMVGHKLWEFSFTRIFRAHPGQKK